MNVYVQPTVSTQKPPGLQGSGVGRPRSSIDSALRPCLTWGGGATAVAGRGTPSRAQEWALV